MSEEAHITIRVERTGHEAERFKLPVPDNEFESLLLDIDNHTLCIVDDEGSAYETFQLGSEWSILP